MEHVIKKGGHWVDNPEWLALMQATRKLHTVALQLSSGSMYLTEATRLAETLEATAKADDKSAILHAAANVLEFREQHEDDCEELPQLTALVTAKLLIASLMAARSQDLWMEKQLIAEGSWKPRPRR